MTDFPHSVPVEERKSVKLPTVNVRHVRALSDAIMFARFDHDLLEEIHQVVSSLSSGAAAIYDPKISLGVARSLMKRAADGLEQSDPVMASEIRRWLSVPPNHTGEVK